MLGLLLAGLACAGCAAADEPAPVAVELISEYAGVVPGQPSQLGLRLRHGARWHTYWINPGDSGLPTTLKWTLPVGFKAEDVDWPLPQRFEVGGLYNFGYDGEIVLPVALDVPADAKPGSTVPIRAEAKWLVCREECIPGTAALALDLPVVEAPAHADPRWTAQFAAARLRQPQANAWKGEVHEDGPRIRVTLRGPGLPDGDGLDAFVAERKVLDNKPPALHRDGDALVIDAGKSEYFTTAPATLDVVVTAPAATGARGWSVKVPYGAASAPPPAPTR